MTPSPNSPSASAPLPPLPDFSGKQGGESAPQSGMASLLSGLMPVKMGVDQIMAACKQIVTSGVIPGSEQICGQIVALAASLLPMAAQAAMQPGGSAGPSPVGQIGPVGQGPQPIMGGQ